MVGTGTQYDLAIIATQLGIERMVLGVVQVKEGLRSLELYLRLEAMTLSHWLSRR